MAHEDKNKERCLVLHWGMYNDVLPQCIRCSKCYEFIRPEDMNNDCPADKEVLSKAENVIKKE